MSTAPSHLQPRLRSLYRQFLRELPARVQASRSSPEAAGFSLARSPLQERIRASFAPATAESVPASEQSGRDIVKRIQEGEQFAKYLKSQRMYTTLIERYNPGMDMDEEERVRLTARRVGMDLPEEYKR